MSEDVVSAHGGGFGRPSSSQTGFHHIPAFCGPTVLSRLAASRQVCSRADVNLMIQNGEEVKALTDMLFGDFMVPGADPQIYEEILDPEKLLATATEYLSDHNATSKKPMELVLFNYALEHMARIARVIKLQGGHCMAVSA